MRKRKKINDAKVLQNTVDRMLVALNEVSTQFTDPKEFWALLWSGASAKMAPSAHVKRLIDLTIRPAVEASAEMSGVDRIQFWYLLRRTVEQTFGKVCEEYEDGK